MSAVGRILFHNVRLNFRDFKSLGNQRCLSSSVPSASTKPDPIDEQSINENVRKVKSHQNHGPMVPSEYRYVYPEFLPDPSPAHRNSLREKLERMDMVARRTIIDIPEFYVGSILAVTYSERHAPGKSNRFVGICIQRKGCGLRASFILRNVIDHQGIEVVYELYDPAIQKIECLRLQKRLDDELLYLRDAPAEYSTFPVDMETEYLPEGSPVPVNAIKIPLNPQPWCSKWECKGLKGVIEIPKVSANRLRKAELNAKPWEKYDLMKIYRETIPEEEQQMIYSEVYTKLHSMEMSRKKLKRKRSFTRPTKNA
ncbi:hypothetical protein PV326_008213 [Microctonus aethiopoides]|uniref:Large ribosomal subunit protein bL19m n=1 Tax=Microctonus aethiopoides TaxID=144406 RepID=A0AA39FP93_9HYME|nr:hypothetical protein PV326_008213 [Microctonus aethiopoides]KAK0173295.1 hypothetical protein PV328_006512 [Microctonus aethiopoides]